MARRRLFTPAFAVLTAASFAYFTSYAVLIPTLPVFVEERLGGGKVAVGVAVGAFAVAALAFRPWVGGLGDRRGRRLLIVAGSGLVALSTLLMTLVGSLLPLVLLRLAGGIGEALFFVGAVTVVNDLAPPDRRGEAVSLFSVSLYAGVALGPLLGESVLDATADFDAVWVVAAVLALIALALGALTPETRPERAPGARRGRLLHPAGIAPGAIMFTSVFGFAGFSAFVPLYVDDVGLDGARGLFGVYGAILVAIRLFGARIPDVFGVERVGRAGLALSTVGLTTVGLWRGVAGLFVGTSVFAVGQALAFPAFMAMSAGTAPPSERAAAVGTTTAFIDLGFSAGPVALGALAAQLGVRSAFVGGAAVALAGLLLQLGMARGRRDVGRDLQEPERLA